MSKNIKTKNPELFRFGVYIQCFSFYLILTYTIFRTNSRYTRIPAISKLRLADNDHMFIISFHCIIVFNL